MAQSTYTAVPTLPEDIPATPDGQHDPMGNEEQLLKPENRNGDGPAWYIAVGAATLIAVTSLLTVVTNGPLELSYFAFHMPLNTLAILGFTLAIVQLQPTSQPRTKIIGLERHQLGMFVALPLITLGVLSIYINKVAHKAPHFTTWHGTFGIICFAWLVAQFLFGGLTVWFGGAAFGGGLRAKLLWKYHRMSGYVLFPTMLFTLHLGGAWSSWMDSVSPFLVRLLIYTLVPAALLGAVYVRVRPSKLGFM
ncbi:hypothetical protein K488DRAFT_82800 [Vararia minispora EC-137]|uniref:Uncharacterized protein n=1 Tax=Vararia minispora EC-137 TaxID=1314806 RepID=A0ACB8QW37_9AGAM|nr:hypothetical protein K488DRAFT_82800 [Vararia minispora EC-137]